MSQPKPLIRRSTRFTFTSHRQGRDVISDDEEKDNDDGDGDDDDGDTGGDAIDWENIQEEDDEQLYLSFFFSLFLVLVIKGGEDDQRGVQQLSSFFVDLQELHVLSDKS